MTNVKPSSINFVLPSATKSGIPQNAVGQYIKSLLHLAQGIATEVSLNGNPYHPTDTPSNPTTFSKNPLSRFVPNYILALFKDYQAYRTSTISTDFFVNDAVNVVFVGHGLRLPQLESSHHSFRLVGILDEPPSFGDNFKTRIFYRRASRRFHKELRRFDALWVYHSAARSYLNEAGVHCPIHSFPCIIDYSPIFTVPRSHYGKPLRIVMASSFLPWHGIPEMLDALSQPVRENKIVLTLIGDGPMKDVAVLKAKNSPNVRFLSGMSFSDYQNELTNHDCGLLWKIPWFNSPLKLMDYARAGIGIITAETEAIKSIWPRDSYFSIDEFIRFIESDEWETDVFLKKNLAARHHIENNWTEHHIQEHLKNICS